MNLTPHVDHEIIHIFAYVYNICIYIYIYLQGCRLCRRHLNILWATFIHRCLNVRVFLLFWHKRNQCHSGWKICNRMKFDINCLYLKGSPMSPVLPDLRALPSSSLNLKGSPMSPVLPNLRALPSSSLSSSPCCCCRCC